MQEMSEEMRGLILKAGREVEEFCNSYLLYVIPKNIEEMDAGEGRCAVGMLITKGVEGPSARALAKTMAQDISNVKVTSKSVICPIEGLHTFLKPTLERIWKDTFTAWLVIGKEVTDGKESGRFLLYKGDIGIKEPYTDLLNCLYIKAPAESDEAGEEWKVIT